MNYTDAIKKVTGNSNIIGKDVKYNNEIYTVKDIFPCPSGGNQRMFFIKKYNELGRKLAVEHFMTSTDLGVSLYCEHLKIDTPLFIDLNDVEFSK